MKSVNHKIEQMMDMHNNHPLSTKCNISSLQLHKQIFLKQQVIDTLIDHDTLHYFNEWKGIGPIAEVLTPVVVEPPQD